MTHAELRRLIAGSSAFDWHHTSLTTERDLHPSCAAYRPNVAVGLAWGLPVADGTAFDRSGGYPNARTGASYIDVLYQGTLVERQMRIRVEGRGHLPLPTPKFSGHKITGYSVTGWEFALVGLLHAIEQTESDYGEHVDACGIRVIGDAP